MSRSDLQIKYGSTIIYMPLLNSDLVTIADVKEFLKSQNESVAPESIKLISSGKVLDDSTVINEEIKLTMVASKKEQLTAVSTVLPIYRQVRVKNDLDTATAAQVERKNVSSVSLSRESRFGDIQILPGLPFQERAREILLSLANDPGVIACMKKHNWRVGALSEMYPEGEVGISEVCVLGLNENKGERILLRIRTDDLTGFRNATTIQKVLCHELAHCVHSEHDSKFYQLMRQVENEVVEMNWMKSPSRYIGSSSSLSTPAPLPQVASPAPLPQVALPAPLLSGANALENLPFCRTCEEPIVPISKEETSLKPPDGVAPSVRAVEEDHAQQKPAQDLLSGGAPVAAVVDWSSYDQSVREVSSRVDEAIALSFSLESSTSAAEKLLDLHASLLGLLQSPSQAHFESPAQVLECLALLAKIVKNAHDASKSRIDTTKSTLFRRVFCRDPVVQAHCDRIFLIAGFTMHDSVLAWTRGDNAVLNIVQDVLETAHELLKPVCA